MYYRKHFHILYFPLVCATVTAVHYWISFQIVLRRNLDNGNIAANKKPYPSQIYIIWYDCLKDVACGKIGNRKCICFIGCSTFSL